MADTTTQTSWPALRVSTIRRATRLMLSAFVSDDPPYFWTTKLTRGSGLRLTAKGPVYDRSPAPMGSTVCRDLCRPPNPTVCHCSQSLTSERHSRGYLHGDDERGEQDVLQVAFHGLQPPSVAEDGQQHPVAAREHLDRALTAKPVPALGIDATSQGVPQGVERDRRVELMRHPMLGDLELHGTDRRQDRRLVTSQIRTQHLHDTLVIELFDTAPELLVAAGVLGPGHGKVLWREGRDRREGDRFVDEERVAHPQSIGVDQADHVARKRAVDALALATHDLLGVLGGEGAVGDRVGDDHASLEGSRADTHEGEAVAVGDIHAGLHLEDESAERGVDLTQDAGRIGPGAGCRSQVDQGVEQEPDTEVEDG